MKKLYVPLLVVLVALGFSSCSSSSGGGDPETFQTITVGTPYSAISIAADGEKLFKFVTRVDGEYTVTVSGCTAEVDWALLDSSDLEAVDNQLYSGTASSGHDSKVPVDLTADTTYYITVYEAVGSSGHFTLRIDEPI